MNKSNFKLLVIGAMATAMLASCNKNNGTEGNAPENGFRATIEQPAGNGSRTHINPDWANDASTDVLWTAADLIKVANGNGTVLNYQITEGENTSNGVFYTGEEHEDFFQPNYAAIYPAFNAEDVANGISGTTATFNVPQTQTYRANSFAEKSMPMVAYSTDQTLAFKNVFGGICIPLVGDGLTVTRVVLTSANASEHLYGVFTADCTSATPAPTYVSGGGNSVTLDCSATPVTLDANNSTYFCFMVPPASLASGFAVTPYNGETAYEELSTTANPGIMRSVIKKVDRNLEVEEAVVVPDGAIAGAYSVSATQQVWFSQGNLQYIGSATTPYWKFADNQWDCLGKTTSQNSTNQNADRDLFGWGTSGYHNDADTYNTNYYPYSTSTSNVNTTYNYYGYGPSTNMTDPNLVGTSANYDWGIYNNIMAGETEIAAGTYRTLTNAEWGYLFSTRKVTVGGVQKVPYGEGVVNGVNGVILLPDNWDGSVCSGFTYGESTYSNSFSESTTPKWSDMEAAGCVFLPAAGRRRWTSVDYVGSRGYYWSSTCSNSDLAYRLLFGSGYVLPQYDYGRRYNGFSVRLACPAE